MSHPPELIRLINGKLLDQYPASLFTYFIEKAIPGTRMMPDILIRDSSGNIRCAVEIGYTRPEKLTFYRTALGIPDVRWYDKEGNLHTVHTEEIVIKKLRFETEDPGSVWIYELEDRVSHDACPCLESPLSRLNGKDANYVERVEERFIRRFGKNKFESLWDEYIKESFEAVLTWMISDGVRCWLPSYCDKCGESWSANPDEFYLFDDLQDENWRREFGREFGAGRDVAWDVACSEVSDAFGFSLVLDDGHFIHPDHRREIAKLVVDHENHTGANFGANSK